MIAQKLFQARANDAKKTSQKQIFANFSFCKNADLLSPSEQKRAPREDHPLRSVSGVCVGSSALVAPGAGGPVTEDALVHTVCAAHAHWLPKGEAPRL